MNSLFTKFTATTLCLCMFASCTNIQNDGTRTRTEGALGGAALGAGLGALIGAASGNAGRGALIGLAAGSIAGLAYGNHVANKKAQYRSTEAWLDACIAQARRTNQNARSYNSTLSARISKLSSEIAAAKASGNRGALRQKKAEIINLENEASKQMKTIDSEITNQNRVLGEASSPTLKNEVISLRSTRSNINSNYQRLASLSREADA
ncbi:YMGG-like glycine zipper-containing protein [Prosthecobacter sp.]|uniref:YMGG-like glycine zipper-containing protein n=1 Tax=Prosthecobacter sp. TaxID=1965333 RepID=UPI001DE2EEA3|nr:YMGG-like glycine zipper-containing protein [Prosthecobacter sp.]MCB1276520.1 hypothetical protein [Prosthecobacter sp.]